MSTSDAAVIFQRLCHSKQVMATSIEFVHGFSVNDAWDREQDSLAKVPVSQVPLILQNSIRCRAADAGQRTMLMAVQQLQGYHMLNSTKPWLMLMSHLPERPHSPQDSPCNLDASHSNAIRNQRFKKRIELRRQTQPFVAEHRGGTNSRMKRPQPHLPHTRGTLHRRLQPLYTEKHKVSCSGFLPTR